MSYLIDLLLVMSYKDVYTNLSVASNVVGRRVWMLQLTN